MVRFSVQIFSLLDFPVSHLPIKTSLRQPAVEEAEWFYLANGISWRMSASVTFENLACRNHSR